MSRSYDTRVIVSYGPECIVEAPDGTLQRCLLRGRGRRPVCGDWVQVATEGGSVVVERIHERRNVLERGDFRGRPRPLAANVDRMVIVTADPPGIDPLLIDRYLVVATYLGADAAIWVNKADALSPTQRDVLRRQLTAYAALDLPLAFVSARADTGIDHDAQALGSGTSILVGHSGVGKSSLINRLIPDLDLRIGAVSEAGGQGRHTTTATTLFHLPGGGALIDSPGVRTLRLDHLPGTAVLDAFPEVRRHVGHCRFRDCRHDAEPGCAVRAALARGELDEARFRNFQTLLGESGSAPR